MSAFFVFFFFFALGSKKQKKMKIERFDPKAMKCDRIVFIVGPRDTGKSTLMWDILYHLKDKVDVAFGVSPSLTTLTRLQTIMPVSHIRDEYTVEFVEEVVAEAKRCLRAGKPRHFLLLLDDCMADKKLLKSPVMRDIAMNGRQFFVTLVVTCQYMMSAPPEFRTNIDYVFALRELMLDNRTRLRTYFFGMLKQADFERVLDGCTNNFECLVLDKTQRTTDKSQLLSYYRGNADLPPFQLSRPVYFLLDKWDEQQHQRQQQQQHHHLPHHHLQGGRDDGDGDNIRIIETRS